MSAPALDIKASLRRLADQIEAGEMPDLRFIALVGVCSKARDEAGPAQRVEIIAAYGECAPFEAAGAFARAVSLVD